jgi:hypothetical protein
MKIPVLHPIKKPLEDRLTERVMQELVQIGKARDTLFAGGRTIYMVNGHHYIYREQGKYYERLR